MPGPKGGSQGQNKQQDDSSAAFGAIETLLKVIQNDRSTTLRELMDSLRTAVKKAYIPQRSPLSLVSACELFTLFITLSGGDLENPSIEECRRIMLDRGELFFRKLAEGRDKLPKVVLPFIADGSNILTNSLSHTVLRAMTHAAKNNIQFNVYVTMGAPNDDGKEMVSALTEVSKKHGGLITVKLVPDTAIGYLMERVDLVLVGAEGVTQPGGVVSQLGTYTMALAAHEAKRPFYVLAESFKFMQIYPLNQADLLDDLQRFVQQHTKHLESVLDMHWDYTPPRYISMLFTDLGAFTPAAVSEKLIELYT